MPQFASITQRIELIIDIDGIVTALSDERDGVKRLALKKRDGL
jgi:hypothetical protein